MLNFVGSMECSTPNFQLHSPLTKTTVISSRDRRRSLADVGVDAPVTVNVLWEDSDVSVGVTRIVGSWFSFHNDIT